MTHSALKALRFCVDLDWKPDYGAALDPYVAYVLDQTAHAAHRQGPGSQIFSWIGRNLKLRFGRKRLSPHSKSDAPAPSLSPLGRFRPPRPETPRTQCFRRRYRIGE